MWEAKKNGCGVITVDRWLPSSKVCHVCGAKIEDLTLKERVWVFEKWGTWLNRDVNAVINILNAGLATSAS